MMRPSVPAPTGTLMPLPVFVTARPRRRPSEGPMAIAANDAVAQLLLHLERQVDIIELERVVDLGDLIARKFHVDDRTDDLHDFA